MNYFAFALLLAIAQPASAKLITYDYESHLSQPPPKNLYPFGDDRPTGSFTFDTEDPALTEFSIDFNGNRFSWSGRNALTVQIDTYGYVNADETTIQLGGDFSVDVVWEVSSQPGTLPSEILGNFGMYAVQITMPGLYWRSPDLHYYTLLMDPSRIKEVPTAYQPMPVPEPATLSLLALGLAAIGIRRRLR